MERHSVEQFLRLGYTTVPFSGILEIRTAVQGFIELVRAFPFQLPNVCFDNDGKPTDPSDDSTDLGYIRRTGTRRSDGQKYDIKTFLHYAGDRRLQRALAMHHPDFLEAIKLILQSNESIYSLCQGTVSRFAQQLDPYFGGNGALSSKVGKPDDKLRTLVYQGIRPDSEDEIGQRHCDQSGISIALYEDCRGLEFLINGEWQEMSTPSGVVTLFAGQRMEIFSQGRIKAIPHRVRINKKTTDPREIIRSALVFFSNIEGIELK